MTPALQYLAPAYRSDPAAEEFAAALAAALPWTAADFGAGYAWDDAIPPRPEWPAVVAALAVHLNHLTA